MTNPVAARPEPSPDVPGEPKYDSFLVPRSKTPEKQRFYDWLLDYGWRYAAQTAEWFTPLNWPLQGRGRLAWTTDFSRAWIQPPWDGVTTTTLNGVELPSLGAPLLTLVVDPSGQVVQSP